MRAPTLTRGKAPSPWSYATTSSLPSGITNTDGVTGTASPRYNMILPTVWGIHQTLSLGYDFKTTNNDILFGGVSVFPSTSEVDQFVATYSGGLADPTARRTRQ
jgi:hypothetical protein